MLVRCGSILLGGRWCDILLPPIYAYLVNINSAHTFATSLWFRSKRRGCLLVCLHIMAIVTNSHSFGSQKEPHDVRVNGNKILFGVLRGGAPR